MTRLLTCKELQAMGIGGRTKIYQMVQAGTFPQPLKYGHTNRWEANAVENWITEQHNAAQARANAQEGQHGRLNN